MNLRASDRFHLALFGAVAFRKIIHCPGSFFAELRYNEPAHQFFPTYFERCIVDFSDPIIRHDFRHIVSIALHGIFSLRFFRVQFSELLLGAEQSALDRADGNAEPTCDLCLRQVLEIAEIQDLPVRIAEPFQRFMYDHSGCDAVDPDVHCCLIQRFQRNFHSLCLRAKVILALVSGNAEDPLFKQIRVLQRFCVAVRRDLHFLQDVFRIREITDAELDEPLQRREIFCKKRFESDHVLTSFPLHQDVFTDKVENGNRKVRKNKNI